MVKTNSNLITRVRTPKFRVSFPSVFEPRINPLNGKNEYSIVMMFNKHDSTVMAELQKLYQLATDVAIEKFGPNLPVNLKMPFRDGDVDRPEYYKDHIWVTSKSTIKPGIVDQQCNLVTPDSPDFYAGCYCLATVQVFAYGKMGNNGISIGLQNIQIIGKGESFTMRKAAENDFTPISDQEVDQVANEAVTNVQNTVQVSASNKSALFGPRAAPAINTPKVTTAAKKMFG